MLNQKLECPKCNAKGNIGEGFRRHGKKQLSQHRTKQQIQCKTCGSIFYENKNENSQVT